MKIVKTVVPARTACSKDWRWTRIAQAIPYGQGYKSQREDGAGEMIKEGDGSHGKSWDFTGQGWKCFEGLEQGRGVILV